MANKGVDDNSYQMPDDSCFLGVAARASWRWGAVFHRVAGRSRPATRWPPSSARRAFRATSIYTILNFRGSVLLFLDGRRGFFASSRGCIRLLCASHLATDGYVSEEREPPRERLFG